MSRNKDFGRIGSTKPGIGGGSGGRARWAVAPNNFAVTKLIILMLYCSHVEI